MRRPSSARCGSRSAHSKPKGQIESAAEQAIQQNKPKKERYHWIFMLKRRGHFRKCRKKFDRKPFFWSFLQFFRTIPRQAFHLVRKGQQHCHTLLKTYL